MSNAISFYTIQQDDTLGKVSKRFGTSVSELCKINGIKNANKVAVGQRIAIRAEAVCKVGVQLLDRDRNPIRNARIRLEYCGRVQDVSTGKNGRVPDIQTGTPQDPVKIFIERGDGSWKEITSVLSGWGNKLVTLVSPAIKIESETKHHPKEQTGQPKRDKTELHSKSIVPPRDPKESTAQGRPQSTYGDSKGLKTRNQSTKDGLPATKVTNDQAEWDFLEKFSGEVLTDCDFEWAAKQLNVEEAVIRAINEVEAAGKGFVELYGRQVPKILYERHYYHKLTGGKYSYQNPDISWMAGYYQAGAEYVPATRELLDSDGHAHTVSYWRRYNKKKDAALASDIKTGAKLYKSGEATKDRDRYLAAEGSYKRLSKAYALDKEAALRSCSWGGFQIMGDHFATMGYATVFEFVRAMSRSEREQIRALILFFKKVDPSLIPAMQKKNFVALARGFNGPNYRDNKYDDLLLASYKKWCKK